MSKISENFDLNELYQIANARIAEMSPHLPNGMIRIDYMNSIYKVYFKVLYNSWNITGHDKE